MKRAFELGHLRRALEGLLTIVEIEAEALRIWRASRRRACGVSQEIVRKIGRHLRREDEQHGRPTPAAFRLRGGEGLVPEAKHDRL